jgi:hypothetical protein
LWASQHTWLQGRQQQLQAKLQEQQQEPLMLQAMPAWDCASASPRAL